MSDDSIYLQEKEILIIEQAIKYTQSIYDQVRTMENLFSVKVYSDYSKLLREAEMNCELNLLYPNHVRAIYSAVDSYENHITDLINNTYGVMRHELNNLRTEVLRLKIKLVDAMDGKE